MDDILLHVPIQPVVNFIVPNLFHLGMIFLFSLLHCRGYAWGRHGALLPYYSLAR